MATSALKQEVDSLREYMKELSYQVMRTDMSVNRLSEEMREFKDETKSRLLESHIDSLLGKLEEPRTSCVTYTTRLR